MIMYYNFTIIIKLVIYMTVKFVLQITKLIQFV